MLHGCTIADGSLIGIGATVLNGAKIGKNCLIGAHSLIPERQGNTGQLPGYGRARGVWSANSSDEEAKQFNYPAEHYVQNWQRCCQRPQADLTAFFADPQKKGEPALGGTGPVLAWDPVLRGWGGGRRPGLG